MVGSRRKVKELQSQLLAEGAVTPAAVAGVRAPIGLDLGAETPSEIAVSIVAELIAVRRGGSGAPLATVRDSGRAEAPRTGPAGTLEGARVWAALAGALAEARPCALATVVQARGSTPRGAGACMLVTPGDGGPVGSVGGGRWEAEVQRIAAECLRSGEPVRLSPRYLDEADMICGGSAEVFIEPVVAERG
jgi:xanthine dehydrogenase accessory factor